MIGTLENDIAKYVSECKKRDYTPDAFAFALSYPIKYGKTPGRILTKLIERELKRHS